MTASAKFQEFPDIQQVEHPGLVCACLPPLTRDGNPGNSYQGAASLFSPVAHTTYLCLSLFLSLLLSLSLSCSESWCSSSSSTAVHADQCGSPSHVYDLFRFIPQMTSVEDTAGVFFFLWNLMWLDLIMMERCPTDCVSSLLCMWFSARLTFPAC